MTPTAMIGLGILAWILMAVLVALFVARMISLRDRQRPDLTEQGTPAESGSGGGVEPFHTRQRRHTRSKT